MLNSEMVTILMANGSIGVEWLESKSLKIDLGKQKLQQEAYKRLQSSVGDYLLFLGFSDENISLSPSLEFWRSFAKLFVQKLIQTPDLEQIREKAKILLSNEEVEGFLEDSPFMIGSQYLDEPLLRFLWARLNGEWQKEIQEHSGSVEEFMKGYSPNIHLLGRIYFHLVENKNSEEFPFAFLATYSTSLTEKGDAPKHLPLKCALQEYENEDGKLLQLLTTVEEAAQKSELMADLLESGEIFHPLGWRPKETFIFLKEIPLYEELGILCRIPNWWKNKSASLRVNIQVGDDSPTLFGMDSLLEFNAQLLLGDEIITEEEARRILEEAEGLAYIKGKWVEVDSKKLSQVLSVFEKAQEAIHNNDLDLKDALRMQLGTQKILNAEEEDLLQISNGKWLQSIMNKLQNPKSIKEVKPGRSFKANLRAYQQDGLNWLHFLHHLKCGACLADDMGLGKTLQILAFLNKLKGQKEKKKASLLIIPASLLSNWQNEIERFAPKIKYFIAHSSYTALKKMKIDTKFLDKYDLIITTYALVQKYDWLKTHAWNYVILDEAQAIKNPGTKQTKAVKKLNAYNRIALTGTPIENKLSDLWSIYDFINPGLLGNAREFTNFSKTLKQDSHGYSRLKKVIHPYLLRRLKTDKTVIRDLPDKIEMKIYADLSKKQILLYKKLVCDIEMALKTLEGINRRGLILGSLVKFKQICNHPGQYLGNGEFLEKDSGKFARLKEICETILAKREKVLVFTQFKEITAPLKNFLTNVFGREGLLLHGSTAVKKRKGIIERFQSNEYVPFFILSVKAGGVGLNLTEANHVIHFDRWWNPAVENQATDRAFRIGQKKKVLVHKFITRGTIEEKIDKMLEEKLTLSNQIIESTGENWIMKMNNEEILDLFKFSL